MLTRLRPDFTVPELEAIMDAVDTDGTGLVDYQSFVSWAFSGQPLAPRPPSSSTTGGRGRGTASRSGTRVVANRCGATSTTCTLASRVDDALGE